MGLVRKTWYGGILKERIDRASGRAIVAIAENVSAETKQVTHVISGTLARSVHAAPIGYDGSGDEGRAATTDLGGQPVEATVTASGARVEVGSWLPYACAEWVGRNHPGVTQGLELARVQADVIVHAAFKAEGL